MLKIKEIINDYNALKSYANRSFGLNRHSETERLIIAASKIAYTYNFRYSDYELDGLLSQLASEYIKDYHKASSKKGYVLYDSFGYSNRGLTLQYIRAFVSWGVKFTYILEKPNPDSKEIIDVINNYSNGSFVILNNDFDYQDKAKLIYQAISDCSPEKIFFHIEPWSTSAIIASYALVDYDKYLIDLTDHAFWLGHNAFDFYIGFRNYSVFISYYYRGIPKEKLIVQEYYPIFGSNNSFNGFEMSLMNKKVILTGGAYYKMTGENGKFLEILKRICIENSSIMILIAGAGDSSHLVSFIERNNLSDKIKLIGNRKDITEVFKNVDIYLNTYPLGGGLMCQLAIASKVPLISYNDKTLPLTKCEDLFIGCDNQRFSYYNADEFHAEINRLINDEAYRKSTTVGYETLLLTESQFSTSLREKVSGGVTIADIEIFNDFDKERLTNLYLSMENEQLKCYAGNKIVQLGLAYVKYDPLGFIKCLCMAFVNKVDRLWRR